MLKELASLLNPGAIQGLGELLVDVISASVHSVTALFDLPIDVSSLESSIRLVKSSGFESSNQVPVVASVGLTIGRGFRSTRSGAPSSSSSTTSHSSGFDKPRIASGSASSSSPTAPVGFATVVPKAMFCFLILDVLSILLVRQSMASPCVSKLGIVQWVIGGLALGFPATFMVDTVKRESSFRAAFVTELVLLFFSFLWLCYGGSMVFNAVNACVDSIAPLWWLSYVSSVLSLSVAGTIIFCMVVTTVLSLVYGSAQQK